jgi:hypothetical protein
MRRRPSRHPGPSLAPQDETEAEADGRGGSEHHSSCVPVSGRITRDPATDLSRHVVRSEGRPQHHPESGAGSRAESCAPHSTSGSATFPFAADLQPPNLHRRQLHLLAPALADHETPAVRVDERGNERLRARLRAALVRVQRALENDSHSCARGRQWRINCLRGQRFTGAHAACCNKD